MPRRVVSYVFHQPLRGLALPWRQVPGKAEQRPWAPLPPRVTWGLDPTVIGTLALPL